MITTEAFDPFPLKRKQRLAGVSGFLVQCKKGLSEPFAERKLDSLLISDSLLTHLIKLLLTSLEKY